MFPMGLPSSTTSTNCLEAVNARVTSTVVTRGDFTLALLPTGARRPVVQLYSNHVPTPGDAAWCSRPAVSAAPRVLLAELVFTVGPAAAVRRRDIPPARLLRPLRPLLPAPADESRARFVPRLEPPPALGLMPLFGT